MPAILAIIIANIIWGAAPPLFKYALHDIPPFTLAFIRFFFAGLIFLPFISKDLNKISFSNWKDIVIGGIWGVSINVSLFFIGLQYAPSINVHIISSLGPLVLYIMSLFMLHEKPHPQIIKGMLISLIGIIVIIFAPILQSEITHVESAYSVQAQLIGNACFIASMLGGVLIAIYTKRAIKKVDAVTITSIQFFVGAISFLPFMMNELQTWSFTSLTYSSWVGIIYGVFFASALAYYLHNYALKKIAAQEIGVFTYIMPVVAVIVAIPLLGEYPDIFFIIGAVGVLVGMCISERHPHMQKMHKRLHKER